MLFSCPDEAFADETQNVDYFIKFFVTTFLKDVNFSMYFRRKSLSFSIWIILVVWDILIILTSLVIIYESCLYCCLHCFKASTDCASLYKSFKIPKIT